MRTRVWKLVVAGSEGSLIGRDFAQVVREHPIFEREWSSEFNGIGGGVTRGPLEAAGVVWVGGF